MKQDFYFDFEIPWNTIILGQFLSTKSFFKKYLNFIHRGMCTPHMFEEKQLQISRGDDYNKFYLLTLFDSISMTGSMTFSHGVWVSGFGWLTVSKHTYHKFTYKFLMMPFLVTIWFCLSACLPQCNAWQEFPEILRRNLI